MPAGQKEPGFFSFLQGIPSALDERQVAFWKSVIADPMEYQQLFFDARQDQRAGEATADYLYTWKATLANLAKVYGEERKQLKFIAVLRNPVDRIWSHYMMFRRDSFEDLPFDEAISGDTISRRLGEGWHPSYDYVGYGFYHQALQAFMDEHGRENLKLFLFEELERDPAQVCREVFGFLGVNAEFQPRTDLKYNASGQLRNAWLHDWLFIRQHLAKDLARRIVPYDTLQAAKYRIMALNRRRAEMPAGTRRRMVELYAEDVQKLARLLGVDLTHWLR